MSNFPNTGRGLQRQLRKLFFLLILLTGISSYFFWATIKQLHDAQGKLAQSNKRISVASTLSNDFFEESILRKNVFSSVDRKLLRNLRKKIRSNLKTLKNLSRRKRQRRLVKSIRFQWGRARSKDGYRQLNVLLRSFLGNEKKAVAPLEKQAKEAAKMASTFVLVYVGLFALAVMMFGLYFKRRIFIPLNRLFYRIKQFQAQGQSPPPASFRNDEIGHLEMQFYDMASRVSGSFEDLKELDQVKTDFISIVSHELRTPMTSVKGSLSLLLSGGLSELPKDVTDVLTIAEIETDRLIRLINDILDLTKMEAKKMPMNKEWHGIDEVIMAAAKGIIGLANNSNVQIEYEMPYQIMRGNFDSDRVQQVITNLLSNAVKFSPAGTSVSVTYEPVGKKGVAVKITDSGPGIAEEDQPRVFEKFSSEGGSKLIRGTGLGLPICKAIVEEHGGEIGLTSEEGNGSTFYFTLPEAEIVGHRQDEESAA